LDAEDEIIVIAEDDQPDGTTASWQHNERRNSNQEQS